jgi:hypothetical protein
MGGLILFSMYSILDILHKHLGFIFHKVFPMFISHYSVSYSLGRIVSSFHTSV